MELNLLPFLDLVFAFIGILIVIFALQQIAQRAPGRPLSIDDLVVCVADGEVTLHAGATAAPVPYREEQFAALFASLSGQGGEVRNLAFAFTDACFDTRRAFEESFARFTSLLHERTGPHRVLRLAFRPLSASPEAVSRLLTDWRETETAHGP